MLARDAVVELWHVVTPRTGDAHVRIDLNLHRASKVAVDGIRALLGVTRRLNHGGGTGDEVAAGPDAANVGGVCGWVHLHATARNLKAALHGEEGEVCRLRHGRDDVVCLQDVLRALNWDGAASTRGVGFAETILDHAHASDLPVLADQLEW